MDAYCMPGSAPGNEDSQMKGAYALSWDFYNLVSEITTANKYMHSIPNTKNTEHSDKINEKVSMWNFSAHEVGKCSQKRLPNSTKQSNTVILITRVLRVSIQFREAPFCIQTYL